MECENIVPSIDEQILRFFYENPDSYISGEDLARKLSLSRTSIWSHIQELKEAGLEIQAVPNLGYRITSPSPNLIAADIRAQLSTACIGSQILVFNQTDSTQSLCEGLARDRAQEGLVVFAESQKKGRGRLGRTWASPSKTGLWFSTLFRPPWRPDAVTRLTVLSAVALARAIENETGLEAQIKYPNDLMVKNRKLCGILTEMRTEVDMVQYAILGVGLNVNATLSDFPVEVRQIATSLKIETGTSLNRSGLAARILSELERAYQDTRTGHFSQIAQEWSDRCSTLGKKITAVFGNRKISGTATAIDEDGSLLIRLDNGAIESLRGGDVTLDKS